MQRSYFWKEYVIRNKENHEVCNIRKKERMRQGKKKKKERKKER